MRVGFIGLGTMGSHMALNARKGGHDLIGRRGQAFSL